MGLPRLRPIFTGTGQRFLHYGLGYVRGAPGRRSFCLTADAHPVLCTRSISIYREYVSWYPALINRPVRGKPWPWRSRSSHYDCRSVHRRKLSMTPREGISGGAAASECLCLDCSCSSRLVPPSRPKPSWFLEASCKCMVVLACPIDGWESLKSGAGSGPKG